MIAADTARIRPCVKCGADRVIGLQCKTCKSAIDAKYRAKNREKCRITSAEFRKKNPDSTRASVAKYQKKNQEKARARQAKWRLENPDKVKAWRDKWNAANQEKVIASAKLSKKNSRLILDDSYITKRLNMPSADTTPELIELKRVQLQITRALREINK